MIELSLLLVSSICEANSNFFSEVLRYFFQCETSSLGEEEVDDCTLN